MCLVLLHVWLHDATQVAACVVARYNTSCCMCGCTIQHKLLHVCTPIHTNPLPLTHQSTPIHPRFSAGAEAHVLFSVGIRDGAQLQQLLNRLNSKGFETDDISALEAAQVHLRHLVGGRARSYMGEMPHERIFQVGCC